MSDAVPVRRGPVPANPAITSRTHPHSAEREGDGMAPVVVHRADDREDMGEVMDHVTATMLSHHAAALNAIHEAASSSLLTLADSQVRTETLDEAIRVVTGYRDQLAKEPYSDDTVVILDDIVTDLKGMRS